MKKKEIENQRSNDQSSMAFDYSENLVLDQVQTLSFIETINPNSRLEVLENFRGLEVKYRIKEIINKIELYGYKIVAKFQIELKRKNLRFRFEILRGYDNYNEEFKLELSSILYYLYSGFFDFDVNKSSFYYYSKQVKGQIEFNQERYDEKKRLYEGSLRIFSRSILYKFIGLEDRENVWNIYK